MNKMEKTEPVKIEKKRGRPRKSEEHKKALKKVLNEKYYQDMKKAREIMKKIKNDL